MYLIPGKSEHGTVVSVQVQDSPNQHLLDEMRVNPKQKRLHVCMLYMLDEMAIQKHVEYAGGQFHAYIGNENCDDSTPVAKDALVLMAVSVNEPWKISLLGTFSSIH